MVKHRSTEKKEVGNILGLIVDNLGIFTILEIELTLIYYVIDVRKFISLQTLQTLVF